MGIFDWFHLDQYEGNYASNYTRQKIDGLNCSQAMKDAVEHDVRMHRAGGELPAASNLDAENWANWWPAGTVSTQK